LQVLKLSNKMNKRLFTTALAFILVATLSVSFIVSVENGVSDLKINELVSIPSSGSDWVEIYYSSGWVELIYLLVS